MKTSWWYCLVALALAGCAAAPRHDGGIVGTGNRPDCEAQAKKDGSPADCRGEAK